MPSVSPDPDSARANRNSAAPDEGATPNRDQTINQELVRETRNQIRSMVDEISNLAETECSALEFYQGFLTRVTSALASIGGAIWRTNDEGGIRLEYHVNMAESGITQEADVQRPHSKLLFQAIETGEPILIPPHSGESESGGAANPTPHLLVIAPLLIEQKVVGLVEIFQRAGVGPTTQRGYLRFVVQMCKIASDFLKNDQLRSFSLQQSTWRRMQNFVRNVHSSLKVDQTAYAVVNEGRRVLDCDRVCVALKKRGRLQVAAMSGLDTIERRADQVKQLNQLTKAVTKAGEVLWYGGEDEDLPPQIEKQLQEYLDLSHAKLLVVHPLRETVPQAPVEQGQTTSQLPTPGPIIGALIVEQLSDDRLDTSMRQKLEMVVTHSEDALSNAVTHQSMFLAPLWSWLGKTAVIAHTRNLPKTIAVLVAAVGLSAIFCLVPASFTLQADGKLKPEQQSEIFADIGGVLQSVLVPTDPQAIVEQGQLLAVMTSHELMAEIQDLQGNISQTNEKIKKLYRVPHAEMTKLENLMVEGDLAEAQKSRDSLENLLRLKQEEAELLNVRAPVRGHVVNWQLRQNLLRRPVQKGQNLMTIIDPETPWQIELEFPERRVSHLLQARSESSEPLAVTFTLASHPGREFRGHLLKVDNQLAVHGDQGNVVLVRIAIDETEIPEELLRSGTRVSAQLHAGTRSLGYVWFHELSETVQATWLLWF